VTVNKFHAKDGVYEVRWEGIMHRCTHMDAPLHVTENTPSIADYHNEGTMKPIHVIAPEGSVVNAQYPCTVGASPVAVGIQVMEAVLEALSKARPATIRSEGIRQLLTFDKKDFTKLQKRYRFSFYE